MAFILKHWKRKDAEKPTSVSEVGVDAFVVPELTPCPNPHHEWTIGRLLIDWQIAADYWARKNEHGGLTRSVFCIEIVQAKSGKKILGITVGRLAIWTGLL